MAGLAITLGSGAMTNSIAEIMENDCIFLIGANPTEAGYSIAEVANQAGHSNVHTGLIYTNPTRERMKEKANLL